MMKKQAFWLLPCLVFLLSIGTGCVSRSAGNSSPLAHGLKSADTSTQAPGVSDARVVMVKPGVIAINGGKVEKLTQGMTISANAILRSDATGRAQLAFANGTTVNISPNSELALADIAPVANSTQSEGTGKGLARLLGGGFGKSSAGSSSQATIGVRGLK